MPLLHVMHLMGRSSRARAVLLTTACFASSCWPGPCLPGSRPAHADDSAYAGQLEAKAATVVVLRIVTKVGEFESSSERMGTLIDRAGVILSTGLGTPRGGMKMQLVSARVVFPGDEKEYDAILGAFDSRLGLAFFQLKDPKARAFTWVDPDDVGDVKVGDELFGVSRLEDGFDYAPYYGTVRILGAVKKPREMWIPSSSWALSSPLFTAAGKMAGVMIQQQGVSEGPRWSKPFLLPASVAKGVIAQGVKASAKALEDLKSKESSGEGGDGDEKADGTGKDPAEPVAPPKDGGDDGKRE